MSYTETSNLANFRMHSDYLLIFGEGDQFYCYGCRNMGEVYQKLTDRIYEEIDFYRNDVLDDANYDESGFYSLFDEISAYGDVITDMDLIRRVYEYLFVDDRNFTVLDQQCRVVASYSHYE